MKKLMLMVGLGTVLGLAALGARIGLADCSDPAGNFTIVEPPCLGVEESGDGYWYNDIVIHHVITDDISVDRVSSERVNQAAIWAKLDGGSWFNIGTGAHSFTSVGSGDRTWHFRSSITTQNEHGVCAVKITPNDDGSARVFGWLTKKLY